MVKVRDREGGGWRQRDAYKEDSNVKREAEIGVMLISLLQREGIAYRLFDFGFLASRTVIEQISGILRHSCSWHLCYGSPKKLI